MGAPSLNKKKAREREREREKEKPCQCFLLAASAASFAEKPRSKKARPPRVIQIWSLNPGLAEAASSGPTAISVAQRLGRMDLGFAL